MERKVSFWSKTAKMGKQARKQEKWGKWMVAATTRHGNTLK
jgi:hypothetical protein